MGLDMYAYVAAREGQQREFWDGGDFDKESGDYVNPKVTKPIEIAYWRKHPNLHGWMERLWEEKGRPGAENDAEAFNGVELELEWHDIENLEADILNENLPGTTGFFFGDDSDEYYRESDLEFVKQAKADLFLGLKVYYNSSW
jgi:hypothetical protein